MSLGGGKLMHLYKGIISSTTNKGLQSLSFEIQSLVKSTQSAPIVSFRWEIKNSHVLL
jgi:hypothetical protein